MTLATAIEKRLESEIARALEIMGHVRDRPEGLNEADTKAAFIDPILSARLGAAGSSHRAPGTDQQLAGEPWLSRTAAHTGECRRAVTGGRPWSR